MVTVGRWMQMIGLFVLPLSMLMEMTNMLGRSFGLSQMVIMLVFGVCIFGLGRLLEGYARG